MFSLLVARAILAKFRVGRVLLQNGAFVSFRFSVFGFQFSVAEGEGLPRRGEEREGENARVEGGEHQAAGRGFKFSIPSALHFPLSAFSLPLSRTLLPCSSAARSHFPSGRQRLRMTPSLCGTFVDKSAEGVGRGEAGRSSAWLERCVRDAEVVGSNPITPTRSKSRRNR